MSSSSHSSPSVSSTLSSSGPAGSGDRLHTGNDEHTRPYVSPVGSSDAELERRRTSLVAMDRKRRLTATSNDEGIPQRRQTILGGADPGSSSRTNFHRPLPTLPPGGHESVYNIPGSSRETAIDILSSSPLLTGGLSTEYNQSSPSHDDLIAYTLPRWQPDSEVTHCPICGAQFNFFYRKHHCRKCGRVVCSSCSPHRITIPRQYIVRPPEPNRRASTLFDAQASSSPTASAQVIDLTGDDSYQSPLSTGTEGHVLNPALGGGEEVRLCNPCVPDPNPDPPMGYGLRPGMERMPGATLPAASSNHPYHRTHHSLSGAQFYGSREDVSRDLRRYRRGSHMLDDNNAGFPGAQYAASRSFDPSIAGSPAYPSRYAIPFDTQPPSHSPPAYSSPRPLSGIFSSHHSGPPGSNFRDGVAGSSGTRPSRVRSLVNPERPRYHHHHHPHRVPVDERDVCPICSMRLPSRSSDGNEEAREAHIRSCIESSSHSGRSPPSGASPQPQSPHLMRMLSFIATEKDCVNEDGSPQECTICMEEYEVGIALARLECLCKFHKSCIVEWFERKKECPVHKLS